MNARGTALFYVTVRCEFDFVSSEDGSKHTVTTYGEAMDSGDKATNKAMSAAYKYACMQAFSIPTEGDNDADATTHEVKPAPRHSPVPDVELSPEQKAHVDAIVADIVQCFTDGDELAGIGLWYAKDTFSDNDERIYAWKALASHSKIRSTLKANKPE